MLNLAPSIAIVVPCYDKILHFSLREVILRLFTEVVLIRYILRLD